MAAHKLKYFNYLKWKGNILLRLKSPNGLGGQAGSKSAIKKELLEKMEFEIDKSFEKMEEHGYIEIFGDKIIQIAED